MKKFVLVIIAALFLGACAQKTCPTYSSTDLEGEQHAGLAEANV